MARYSQSPAALSFVTPITPHQVPIADLFSFVFTSTIRRSCGRLDAAIQWRVTALSRSARFRTTPWKELLQVTQREHKPRAASRRHGTPP